MSLRLRQHRSVQADWAWRPKRGTFFMKSSCGWLVREVLALLVLCQCGYSRNVRKLGLVKSGIEHSHGVLCWADLSATIRRGRATPARRANSELELGCLASLGLGLLGPWCAPAVRAGAGM